MQFEFIWFVLCKGINSMGSLLCCFQSLYIYVRTPAPTTILGHSLGISLPTSRPVVSKYYHIMKLLINSGTSILHCKLQKGTVKGIVLA